MKFMRLGSKADTFEALGNIRSIASEIPSDIRVVVDGVAFHVHKFPLFSKSGKLKRIAAGRTSDEVHLDDFPGGVETFELCAKFCYGITITLNAYNVVAVRCAAELLEMTEDVDKGNLIFKVEVFLSACIFRGWKDAIIALQSTKAYLPMADELEVMSRCVDSIVSKVIANPSMVNWSYTYSRKHLLNHGTSEITQGALWNDTQIRRLQTVLPDWWIEDIAELENDLYWRVFIAIKSKNIVPSKVLGEALHFYAFKWLPSVSENHTLADPLKGMSWAFSNECNEVPAKHRQLLETLVSLLPPEKGCVPCSFLLKLLKAATGLDVSSSTRMELARRAGLQLDEASVMDLLIPTVSYVSDSSYDVDVVEVMVEHFMIQEQSPPLTPSPARWHAYEKRRTRSAENIKFVDSRRSTSAPHSSKLRVAKLIDGYLAEVARDSNLSMQKFMTLADSIPEFARPTHDGIYRAIDIYLKKHPGLLKSERKKICRLLDCKKLSMEACMHAAQNERLPLRVIVQVLFFEHVRANMTGSAHLQIPSSVQALMASQECEPHEAIALEDKWETFENTFKDLKEDLASMKMKMSDVDKDHSSVDMEDIKSLHTSSKPKKILRKLWPGKGCSENAKGCCQ